jgi:beta-lactamase regulating signal transducer with metallopeptidase domain
LIAAALRIALLAGVALAAERLLRRTGARGRHRLLVFTLASLLLPPVFTAPWIRGVRDVGVIAASHPYAAIAFAAVYALGVCVFAIRYALEVRAMSRVRRRAVPYAAPMLDELSAAMKLRRAPRLLIAAEEVGPLSLGLFRPSIVLPRRALETLGDDDLRAVLAHELTHIARGHLVAAHLGRIAQLVWWFDPLVWLLAAAERRVREEACDELVVDGGFVAPEAYCEALLRATSADLGRPLLLAPAFAREHPLHRRIARIMTARANGSRVAAGIALVIAIVAIVTQLGASPPLVNRDLTAAEEAIVDATDGDGDSPSPSPSHSPSP